MRLLTMDGLTDVTRTNRRQSDILGDVFIYFPRQIFQTADSLPIPPVCQLPCFINTQKLAGFPVTEHQVFFTNSSLHHWNLSAL